MRIISGTHKGRRIPELKNFPSRPTTDFAKENLFNIINNNFNFEDIDVLDLFSGTGSISYEFASRGSNRIVAIENDYKSIKFINSVIKQIDFKTIQAIKSDVFKYLEKCSEKFDIIFADPPYKLERLSEIPDIILNSEVIKKDGWLILEHGKNNQFNDNQYLINKRNYGSVHFSIFQKK